MSGTWANVEKIQEITVRKRVRWSNTFYINIPDTPPIIFRVLSIYNAWKLNTQDIQMVKFKFPSTAAL